MKRSIAIFRIIIVVVESKNTELRKKENTFNALLGSIEREEEKVVASLEWDHSFYPRSNGQ